MNKEPLDEEQFRRDCQGLQDRLRSKPGFAALPVGREVPSSEVWNFYKIGRIGGDLVLVARPDTPDLTRGPASAYRVLVNGGPAEQVIVAAPDVDVADILAAKR